MGGLVQCMLTSPFACGATALVSGIVACTKVPQNTFRATAKKVMMVCTAVFLISTIVLFTLSNPYASGGPATTRPLSDQAGVIGAIMGVTYGVSWVLSAVFLIYGNRCCLDTKGQDEPLMEEGNVEKEQEKEKPDLVVLAIAAIHWGILVLGF